MVRCCLAGWPIFCQGRPGQAGGRGFAASGARLSVEIGKLDWAFSCQPLPLSVKMGAVSVSYAGQQMRLPNAEMYFGMSSLVTGLPERLSVTGLELELYHDEQLGAC